MQWQKGFDLAQGEYIWIAESDDFADPGFLSSCVEQLENEPSCTLAYTESRLVDAESRPMKKRMKGAYSKSSPCDMWDGHDFVLRNMLRCNTIYNASMVVFRKAAIPADKTYMQFRLNGDWLFWVEIALQGKVAHINAPYNNFRQHEVKVTQTSRTDGTGLAELLRLYDIFFSLIELPRRTRWAIEGRIIRHARRALRHVQNPIRRREIADMWHLRYPHMRQRIIWYKLYRHLFIPPRFIR